MGVLIKSCSGRSSAHGILLKSCSENMQQNYSRTAWLSAISMKFQSNFGMDVLL